MSLQLRCKCGWASQVSEFYLGDSVTCPECATRLSVHPQAGVPYGYAPYPTWQKRPAARPARQRRYPLFVPQNPHSGPAFWYGLASFMLVFTGCGAVPGALLAMFGVNSWCKSRSFAQSHRQRHETRAYVGLGFSALSLLAGSVMILAMLGDVNRSDSDSPCRPRPNIEKPERPCSAPPYRYDSRSADRYRQQAERSQRVDAEWRAPSEVKEYRYPEVTPVEPRTDWQREQMEYSQNVRRQRQADSGATPRYRYGD